MAGEQERKPSNQGSDGAFCPLILDAVLPAIREVARFNGYAVAVRGTLKRDIDLIAVAWTDQAKSPDDLVRVIQGAVGEILGNCLRIGEPSIKPHGRVAYTLIHPGFCGEIDLSIIPPALKPEGDDE